MLIRFLMNVVLPFKYSDSRIKIHLLRTRDRLIGIRSKFRGLHILPPNYPDRLFTTMTKIVSRPGDHYHPSLELQPDQGGAPAFAFSPKGYTQAGRFN